MRHWKACLTRRGIKLRETDSKRERWREGERGRFYSLCAQIVKQTAGLEAMRGPLYS